ncbi:MAG: LpxA family transferase [Cytophagales bacterium]|nr:LpxA family transferase [Cytophagales bacterium]
MLRRYIARIYETCPLVSAFDTPWAITGAAAELMRQLLQTLGGEYVINDGVALHRDCVIEDGAVLKPPVIVSAGCFVAAHAYLRGGVFLAPSVTVGPGCEVKSSFVFAGSALAHFNFVGDSLVGENVNMEAGAVLANHFNERTDKRIFASWNGQVIDTGATKFGALVGDGTRIGANAVTEPGTLLLPKTVVARLELVKGSLPASPQGRGEKISEFGGRIAE